MTNEQIWERYTLPMPTWLVTATDPKKGKYMWKSYARALSSQSACKAIRSQRAGKEKVALKAHMVNANDKRITWSDWDAYIERVRGSKAVNNLHSYRKLENDRN